MIYLYFDILFFLSSFTFSMLLSKYHYFYFLFYHQILAYLVSILLMNHFSPTLLFYIPFFFQILSYLKIRYKNCFSFHRVRIVTFKKQEFPYFDTKGFIKGTLSHLIGFIWPSGLSFNKETMLWSYPWHHAYQIITRFMQKSYELYGICIHTQYIYITRSPI